MAGDERRQALLGAKLAALVRDRWGDEAGRGRAGSLPGAATLRLAGDAWVLADADGEPTRTLGAALLWSSRQGVDRLHLLLDDDRAAGDVARRAAGFAPWPEVWRVDGRQLVAAEPRALAPEPLLDPRLVPMADLIRAAGADAVVEHGVLTGEVLGLEVARAFVDDEGPRLEVGVGKHDRHAQRLLLGDVPTADALARAVALVRDHRRSDAPPHPLKRLAPERWLRARLVAEPELVGAAHLAPAPSPVVRDDLRQPAPAAAAGLDGDGRPVVVVCSVGIDLELVPAAVDVRLADGRDPRLLVVVPERDDQPVLRTMVDALAEPADVVTVPDDWRRP